MDQARPLSIDEVITRCDLLIERRRGDQARALLEGALAAAPDHPELLYRLALVDSLDGDDAAGAPTVERLLQVSPEHFGGRVLLAQLQEDSGRYADAEASWIALLRDRPESAGLYAGYAGLMLRTLHLDKAQRLAAEALRLEPAHQGALFVMASVELIRGRRGAHSRHLEKLVAEHPENIQTAIALIIALDDRDDGAGALRLARELLRARPDDARLVALVRELRAQYHWSLWPLYPMRRWGWAGAAGVWAAVVVLLQVLRNVNETALTVFGVIWLVYVIYSWTWPSLLKRLV